MISTAECVPGAVTVDISTTREHDSQYTLSKRTLPPQIANITNICHEQLGSILNSFIQTKKKENFVLRAWWVHFPNPLISIIRKNGFLWKPPPPFSPRRQSVCDCLASLSSTSLASVAECRPRSPVSGASDFPFMTYLSWFHQTFLQFFFSRSGSLRSPYQFPAGL